MANQIKIKSILREQLPGAPDWVDQLLLPLNEVILGVGAGFNRGLTFSDNLACQLKTLQLTTPAAYHLVGGSNEPTFSNNWVNYGTTDLPASFRKQNGIVNVRGAIKNGTVGSTAFTLPTAYAPQYTMRYAVPNDTGFTNLRISPTGAVIPETGTNGYVVLDVSFVPADPTTLIETPYPITFRSSLGARATGFFVLAATPVNQSASATTTALPGQVGVDAYDTGKGQIIVNQFYGLLPATAYNVILLAVTR